MSDVEKYYAVLDRYSGGGWDYPDHKAMAWRIVELEEVVERVRKMHSPVAEDHAVCATCKDFNYHVLRALERV